MSAWFGWGTCNVVVSAIAGPNRAHARRWRTFVPSQPLPISIQRGFPQARKSLIVLQPLLRTGVITERGTEAIGQLARESASDPAPTPLLAGSDCDRAVEANDDSIGGRFDEAPGLDERWTTAVVCSSLIVQPVG